MDIIFDIGKVLIDFDFDTSLRQLLPADEPDPHARIKTLLGDNEGFSRGTVDLESYLDHAEKYLPPGKTRADFVHAYRHIFTPNRPMWDRVAALAAAGHRLLYLSDTSPLHVPWIFETYDEVFRHFSGGLASFRVGLLKPDPAFYQKIIADYELTPSRTLYMDDVGANVEAGRAAGLRAFRYDLHRHEDFEAWLTENLIEG